MTLVSQMTEKMWPFLLIGPITVNINGVITCSSTKGLRLKQIVTFDKAGVGPKDFEIKRVISDTEFLVGDPSLRMGAISQPVEYNGGLAAINEQERNTIGEGYVIRNVYESDPVMALRTIMVDEFGNHFNTDNPFPVNVEVTIGTVTVDLDAFSSTPDNVLMIGSEDGTKTGTKHAARVDSALDLRVGISNGSNKALVNVSGELSVTDAKLDVNLSTRASEATLLTRASETTVANINSKLNTLGQKTSATSVPVVLSSDQSAIPVNATVVGGTISADLDAFSSTPDNVFVVGTEDGTKTGVKRGFVNSVRLQILASRDRTQNLIYADFGTKTQRVTKIEYASPDFPGITAVKTLSYSLIGTRYRRDSINWSIV